MYCVSNLTYARHQQSSRVKLFVALQTSSPDFPFTHIRAAETVNMCHIKLLAHTMFIVYLFCRGRNSGEKVKKKKRERRSNRGRLLRAGEENVVFFVTVCLDIF